ncbi:aldehyde dehydrogenase family protein [Halorarum salinum]|uniref:Aldehyde dehydrogenase family protein n=1 Tax=Halorarum salinum TaxID=2743089 RepID=A0A7D5QGL5_9EURY|nr:aldehyde dehydrogenase family protein [Halobaculum salinum]QLG64161.1 aldehyde dehydrogenase family protein [Halobaculum salinum]
MAQEAAESLGIGGNWDRMYVDGEWRETSDRRRLSVENPATREEIATVPEGRPEDVDEAFEAALAAQEGWAARPPQARAEVVQAAMHVMDEHGDELSEVLIAEGGSTHVKAHTELDVLAPGMMAEAAGFPTRSQGTHSDSVIPGKENEVRRVPKGVVGVITPWNVPFHLSMRAVAPAIALGNAVVLKPAPETPIGGGLALAKVFEEAGLPPGVLNVVPGGADPGDAVASHPDADVVSFTGSSEVGKLVARNAGENLSLPALELGGNNPHVVLEDADLDLAVDTAVFGSFFHQGQICISINRHLVHESLYDEYVDGLAERAAALEVGDPAEGADVGPIINEQQRDQMVQFVEESVDAGARVVAGGGHEDLFVEPTVLADVTNDMPTACNEHFGPIAPVIPFSDEEEALEIANDTEYGLTGSVVSEDLGRAKAVARRIDAGMVHVNDQPINDEPHVPFGGVKASGMGRYNGEAILRELTEERWISVQHEPREFPI